MKMLLTLGLLFHFSHSFAADKTVIVEAPMGTHWAKWTTSPETNVRRLVQLLERSSVGKELVAEALLRAHAQGMTLDDIIKVGEGSLTDTTLIRKFHPDSPDEVSFESRSVVYINRHLPWKEGLLDLAHELTHFVERKAFNPYIIPFSGADFVKSTIDGPGGEVEAFLTECKVARELFTQDMNGDSNCQLIFQNGQFSKTKASELFYHVGGFYSQLKELFTERGMIDRFPTLTSEKIKFISSAYGVPYPLAALQEYQTVLSKVCENDRKRLSYMRQGRSPASVEKLRSNIEARCSSVTQN